jgi:hypothetical protein
VGLVHGDRARVLGARNQLGGASSFRNAKDALAQREVNEGLAESDLAAAVASALRAAERRACAAVRSNEVGGLSMPET